MTASPRDLAILEEAMRPLGPITIRRMFGGAGVFRDGLMFALLIEGSLYLKTDAITQPDFQAEGLAPFVYEKKTGQATVMSYWQAPERLLDEPDEMRAWGDKAIEVARRKHAAGRGKTAAAQSTRWDQPLSPRAGRTNPRRPSKPPTSRR